MKVVSLLLIVAFSVPVYADSSCDGNIHYLGMSRNGNLLVSGPGGLKAVYLCNVNTKRNSVDVEACKANYSLLLAAKSQNKPVSITFNPNISSCKDVPSWAYAQNFNWVISK